MTIRTNGQIIGGTSGGITEWGKVKGTLSDQTDLQDALDNKLSTTAITNCITEIPQDIKLELNDGTLTLKAGSKVYVPNGVGVFDAVTINSDITIQGSDNTQYILLYYPQGGYIGKTAKSNVFSGPDGSSVAEYGFWYDTTNNIIKRKLGGVFDAGGYSLPFGLSTATSSSIKSIDQVFNGFGYIGSTVFALPGIKGLIPNGRNADGSLKNIEFTRNSVRVDTFTIAAYTGTFNLYSFSTYNAFQALQKYDEKTNTMVGAYAGSFISGEGYLTNGVITSFAPKTPFHAVDYNDFNSLSNAVIDSRHQVVSAKPSVPTASVFYYVRE